MTLDLLLYWYGSDVKLSSSYSRRLLKITYLALKVLCQH